MSPQTTSEEIPFTWHSAMPSSSDPLPRIVFAVPAKDEEESISDCIAAFENQRDDKGRALPWSSYEVLILVNNTTDATVQRAMTARRHPGIHVVSVELPPHRAHIGWARRLGMDWAGNRLRQNGHTDGIIVSTDADSRIAPNFVCELQQTFASPAVDAAGASLAVEDELPTSAFSYLSSYFSLERKLRLKAQKTAKFDLIHSHFSGAGFAVRQYVYEAVGGLTPLPYNEDKQFYYKLLQRDARIRMNDRLIVHTSSRLMGRTEWGMAAQLRQWQCQQESGESILVSSAHSHWNYFQLQMALHAYWIARTEEKLAVVCHYLRAYQISEPLVFLARIEVPFYFGQYWCCVWEHPKLVEARQYTFPAVSVNDSLADFGLLLSGVGDGMVQRA